MKSRLGGFSCDVSGVPDISSAEGRCKITVNAAGSGGGNLGQKPRGCQEKRSGAIRCAARELFTPAPS
jgi:hypothetical protein